MAAPKLPQQFGPYTLQELIARGGMAEIFRATMPGVGGFEKTVAIKKILPHLAENDEYMTMLIDEARIIVSINHANIAQVYDLGEIDGDYYIAMEYIHGIDLSTMVKELKDSNQTFPVEHALFIASGIAAGLHVAHNKCDDSGRPINIVHRDVSPHNILISFAGDVKIIDFGVAKARGKEAHTQLGVIKGKLLYMAPEQAMAKELDGRADLFAMGLILYRMLTNHLPFEGDNEFQIYNHILSKEIPPPRAFNPNIPEEVNQITMMLLQRDPSKRYQDGYSAKVDLDRALQTVAPGYSISRLSRWVETDFSHLIQKRQRAQSGQNEAPPSTPSHNQVTTGEHGAPDAWDNNWDVLDENEDTVNVAMDSPEAREVVRQAEADRAQYAQMRASGEVPAPVPAPWAHTPSAHPEPPTEERPHSSGQYNQPQAFAPDPYSSQQQPIPQQFAPPGQWPTPPQPNGGPQYPQPSGQWTPPDPAAAFGASQPFPGQSGQYPAPNQQSGQYPAPNQQSGQYNGPSQSGLYAGPNPSGYFAAPGQSGMHGPPSGYYETYQPGAHEPPAAQTAAPRSNGRIALGLGILFLLCAIVVMLGLKLVNQGAESGSGDGAAVAPTQTSGTTTGTTGTTGAVAPPDGVEAAAAADAGTSDAEASDGVRKVRLRAQTTPKGANVFIGENLLGQTPLDEPIPWGEKAIQLRFELEGYETKEIEAIPFADVRRNFDMAPLPGQEAPDMGEPDEGAEETKEEPKKQPKKKPRKRRRRTTKKSSEPSVPLLGLDEKKTSDVPVF